MNCESANGKHTYMTAAGYAHSTPLRGIGMKDAAQAVRIGNVNSTRGASPDVPSPVDTISDAQLIADSGQNPDRFMQLVQRHQRVLYGYLARRFGSELAEEITAETFARAFAQRDRYRADMIDARPWLFGIASNILRSHARSEARRLRAYARTGVDPHGDIDETAAAARVDAGQLGPTLARALAKLSAADRDVLLMFAWAEMSYDEISAALDIPVGTVRSRLNRARRVMRDSLEETAA